MLSGAQTPDGIPHFIIMSLSSLTILLLPWGSENQSALPEWNSNAAERLRATCESRCRSLCMLRRMNTELRAAAHRLHFRQRDSSFG